MCLKIILKFDSELDKDFYLDALRIRFSAGYQTMDVCARELAWVQQGPSEACELLVIEHARLASAQISGQIIRWCDHGNKILVLCDAPMEAPPIVEGLHQAIHLRLHRHGIASYSKCEVGDSVLRLSPEDFASAIQTMHGVAELYTSGRNSTRISSKCEQIAAQPINRVATTNRRFRAENPARNSWYREHVS